MLCSHLRMILTRHRVCEFAAPTLLSWGLTVLNPVLLWGGDCLGLEGSQPPMSPLPKQTTPQPRKAGKVGLVSKARLCSQRSDLGTPSIRLPAVFCWGCLLSKIRDILMPPFFMAQRRADKVRACTLVCARSCVCMCVGRVGIMSFSLLCILIVV